MVTLLCDQESLKGKACILVGGTSNNLQDSPRWSNETHFKEILGCQDIYIHTSSLNLKAIPQIHFLNEKQLQIYHKFNFLYVCIRMV